MAKRASRLMAAPRVMARVSSNTGRCRRVYFRLSVLLGKRETWEHRDTPAHRRCRRLVPTASRDDDADRHGARRRARAARAAGRSRIPGERCEREQSECRRDRPRNAAGVRGRPATPAAQAVRACAHVPPCRTRRSRSRRRPSPRCRTASRRSRWRPCASASSTIRSITAVRLAASDLRHPLELAADERLEPGPDLRADVARAHRQPEHLAEDLVDRVARECRSSS